MVNSPPANAVGVKDTGLISGLRRFPGGEHGKPLQYPHLENPMDKGALQVTVYGVAKSQTRVKQLNTHMFMQRIQ